MTAESIYELRISLTLSHYYFKMSQITGRVNYLNDLNSDTFVLKFIETHGNDVK